MLTVVTVATMPKKTHNTDLYTIRYFLSEEIPQIRQQFVEQIQRPRVVRVGLIFFLHFRKNLTLSNRVLSERDLSRENIQIGATTE